MQLCFQGQCQGTRKVCTLGKKQGTRQDTMPESMKKVVGASQKCMKKQETKYRKIQVSKVARKQESMHEM